MKEAFYNQSQQTHNGAFQWNLNGNDALRAKVIGRCGTYALLSLYNGGLNQARSHLCCVKYGFTTDIFGKSWMAGAHCFVVEAMLKIYCQNIPHNNTLQKI